MSTITQVLSVLPKTALTTIGMCVLGSLSVGIIMRFFVKPVFQKLDAYIKAKHTEEGDKVVGVYGLVKSAVFCTSAMTLTAVVLSMLLKVCTFPMDNSPYLAFLYFVPMAFLQMFFDKNLERIACKFFGIELPAVEEPEEEEAEKPVKPKKVKVFTKKVRYTIDEEGNEVPVEE